MNQILYEALELDRRTHYFSVCDIRYRTKDGLWNFMNDVPIGGDGTVTNEDIYDLFDDNDDVTECSVVYMDYMIGDGTGIIGYMDEDTFEVIRSNLNEVMQVSEQVGYGRFSLDLT